MSQRKQQIQSRESYFVPPITHKYVEHQKYGSAFYQDHTQEQYAIQRAFQSNNFNYLRKLPDNITRGSILKGRLQRAKQLNQQQAINRAKSYSQKQQERSKRINQKKMQQIGTLGYFQLFPYQQSNYQLAKQINVINRITSQENRKKISNIDFRPSGTDIKLTYQDPFKYIDKMIPTNKQQKDQYLFPFHLPQDTYDAFHQNQIRKKYCQNSAKIAGQFYPANNQHSLSKTSKSKLPQIVKQIELFLKKHLPGRGFIIGVTKRDQIEILFQKKLIDDPKIFIVMNGICQSQMLTPYTLRRYLDKWGQINFQNNYLQFVILPTWVKDPLKDLSQATKTKTIMSQIN